MPGITLGNGCTQPWAPILPAWVNIPGCQESSDLMISPKSGACGELDREESVARWAEPKRLFLLQLPGSQKPVSRALG